MVLLCTQWDRNQRRHSPDRVHCLARRATLPLSSTLPLLCSRDYYDILQISRHADAAAIKRAYRKLALKYHPDKVQGSEDEKQAAAKTFAEIGHGAGVVAVCKGGWIT